MSKIDKIIEEYSNHTFASGPYTSSDYQIFEKKYKSILKEIANNIDAKLISFNKNHYTFSAFMERNGNFAYISISDVRYSQNEWRDEILVRAAEHGKDFSGGSNSFTNLTKLEDSVDKVLR